MPSRRFLNGEFNKMGFEHTSVMPGQVLEHQNLGPGKICVDCTLGGAGHAVDTLKAILPGGKLIGIDQDKDAIDHAKSKLGPYADNVVLFHSNFSELPDLLNSIGISQVDAILLDLGFSLNQIRNSRRGFSFNLDEPLDMRMDTRNMTTAKDIVNTAGKEKLADIFFQYGEEKFSRKIADRIVRARSKAPLETSLELAEIVKSAIPAKIAHKQKIHPATRVFQALRIAVNQELERLEDFIPHVPDLLKTGGRFCAISFHSLEDRILKKAINRFEKGCTCPKDLPVCLCGFAPKMKSVFRKPLTATEQEIAANPMARSAKLRVAERI